MSPSTLSANGRQAKLFELLAEGIQDHLESKVNEDDVRRIVKEEVGHTIRVFEIRKNDITIGAVENPHGQFENLLKLIRRGNVNVLLVGPAGTGKTTMAHHLAEAMGLKYGFLSLSAGVTETHLFGRVLPQKDGSWEYVPSQFVDIYENGGVFLLDEVDAADPNVMVSINAAIANGQLANPNGRIHKRHPDCYIIAAANTYGRGGDYQYVGRNQLDAATLDRFVLSTLYVNYDVVLEDRLMGSALTADQQTGLTDLVSSIRRAIAQFKLRRICSTRFVIHAIRALADGDTLNDVKDAYLQDWSADERAKIN